MTFAPGTDESQLMRVAIDAGADDLIMNEDGSFDIITSPEGYETVQNALLNENLKPDASDISMIPTNQIQLTKENAEKLLKLIEMLEDLEDVQNVYANEDIDAQMFAQMN